jgi:hypothetical protein
LDQFKTLTQINLDDLVSSFGWQDRPFFSRLLKRFFLRPAKIFANHTVDYDNAVGRLGLPDGARTLLQNYVCDVRLFGLDLLPDSAFLALSNHPGMTDTVALFASLNRKDLHIIALDRPFLNALPETSKQLFYVHDDPARRMTLVRQVSAHLKKGGAALTFPAGHIEPDPDVYSGAVESLQEWTDSAGVFIRLAPETAVVPVFVRGVISASAAKHWFLRVKKTKKEKEQLAVALQLLNHLVLGKTDVHVRIQIGQPITAKQLGTTDPKAIHQAVLAEMKRLIENPPTGNGTLIFERK